MIAGVKNWVPAPLYREFITRLPIACVDVAIVHRGAVLLVKRKDPPARGQWWVPGGRVWILTGSYQIVREEYELENLPVPWLLKSVDLLTREWQEVGGRWLPRRVTARVALHTRAGLGLVRLPEAAERSVVDRWMLSRLSRVAAQDAGLCRPSQRACADCSARRDRQASGLSPRHARCRISPCGAPCRISGSGHAAASLRAARCRRAGLQTGQRHTHLLSERAGGDLRLGADVPDLGRL